MKNVHYKIKQFFENVFLRYFSPVGNSKLLGWGRALWNSEGWICTFNISY